MSEGSLDPCLTNIHSGDLLYTPAGCYFGGRVFRWGETWTPAEDMCSSCECRVKSLYLFILMAYSFYRPQRSCGQGYVFTRVYDSVHELGVCLRQTPPPRSRQPPPRADPLPWVQTPPGSDTPLQQTPPQEQRQPPPTPKQTPAYGQRAAGTHPTGMHSCLYLHSQIRIPILIPILVPVL